MPGSALRPEWIPDIPAPPSAPLGIPGSLTSHITKQKLPVSALRNISGFPMCGCCKLYGQPAEIEALLGYDFLEGRDWLLEQAFRLLP